MVVDQFTKYFASLQNIRVIKNPGFLDLFAIVFLLAVFILLYVYYFRKLSLGFILIIAGALSNLADRIYFGAVRDFIDIGMVTMNLADISVWAGIIMLLLKSRNAN